MLKLAVPILGVSNSVAAEEFYCTKLGFRRKFAYRPDPRKPDPCYMGIARDGAHLIISSFAPDGPPGKRNVQIFVDDVNGLHEEFRKAGVTTVGEILDQEWGTFDMGVKDLDGNSLTFSQEKGS